MNIGQRIKQRRKELKMSADELAQKLGKNRATIFRYENGDIENLPLDILEPIANALHTTPSPLMGWEEVQKNNDVISDIIVKLRTDAEFLSVVKKAYSSADFLSVVKCLEKLDNKKLNGVKQMLSAFLK